MTSTIHLTTKEDRRTWQALTRCAPTPDDGEARLSYVALDGERAFATDGYLVGMLPATVDLPIVETEEITDGNGEQISAGYAQPDRLLLPPRLLRDAIGLAKGDTQVRLTLRDDAAYVVLGEDPLPGLGEAPWVRIPYADASGYPDVATLARHVDGDPLEIFTEPDDANTVAQAVEVVTRVGFDAERLALLSALEYRLSSSAHGHVTLTPRPGTRILEIRAAATGAKLGVLAQLHLYDRERPGNTASGETSRTEVRIDSDAADRLRSIAEGLEEAEREARDDD